MHLVVTLLLFACITHYNISSRIYLRVKTKFHFNNYQVHYVYNLLRLNPYGRFTCNSNVKTLMTNKGETISCKLGPVSQRGKQFSVNISYTEFFVDTFLDIFYMDRHGSVNLAFKWPQLLEQSTQSGPWDLFPLSVTKSLKILNFFFYRSITKFYAFKCVYKTLHSTLKFHYQSFTKKQSTEFTLSLFLRPRKPYKNNIASARPREKHAYEYIYLLMSAFLFVVCPKHIE